MKGLAALAQQGGRDASLSVPAQSSRSDEGALLEFDAVYEDHVDRVARWVARLLGPSTGIDVEDVVQEVFVVVHRQLAGFRGDAKLSTWIYRIAEKLSLHRLRTERRRRFLRGLFGVESGPGESDGRSPGDELEDRQQSAMVYRVLEGMSERDRTLLILFEMEGHSGEEIAEMCGVKLPTVWVRLHRARAQFRARVAALPVEDRHLLALPPSRRSVSRGAL